MNKCSNCKYSQHIDGDVRYWCMGQKNMPVVLPNDTCKDWKADRATNADKIRQMSDEDPAEYIRVFFPEVCPPGNCPGEDYCYKCWLDWLKQEVSDEPIHL